MLITATLPADLAVRVRGIRGNDDSPICIDLASSRRTVACPVCGTPAQRVHSRYRRTLTALPWQGVAVQLQLEVRRFFCAATSCSRQTFAEPVPGLAAAHRRRRARLTTLYGAIALALGGEAGARLVGELGLQVSPATLLRHVSPLSAPASEPVRVLGVDDWTMRRGQRYGTILVDLKRHAVIDLLPDREAATLRAWLQAHPEVQIISRDRASSYAEAARTAAPQAIQVADRFHLLKNVGDALERLLQGQPEALRAAAQPDPVAPPASALLASDAASLPNDAPASPVAPAAPRPRRGDQQIAARYARVQALAAAGYGIRALGREAGLSRPRSASSSARACPVRAPRAGLFTPGSRWEVLRRERWDAGCQNATTLWQEVQAAGFPGSAGAVRRHVGAWRTGPRRRGRPPARPPGAPPAPAPQPAPAPRQVNWWLLAPADELTADQQAYRQRLRAAAPQLATAQQLAQAFGRLLRARDRAALGDWLQQAEQRGSAEFRALAVGMRRDRAAIEAALLLPWSQGQTEGQVTRLKLLKRAMYGRGGLDLLRGRVRRGA